MNCLTLVTHCEISIWPSVQKMILLKCKVCYFYSALFFLFLFFRSVQLITSLGREKTESNCLANFPRTISQTSSLFRQSQHKRKIRDKNKRYCRQNKCSDLTCTKKYALTEGPKREGELMWATRSAPPVILCLLRA